MSDDRSTLVIEICNPDIAKVAKFIRKVHKAIHLSNQRFNVRLLHL